jgi:anaerobic ribonucleoside-triphosphate reductase activating protein
VAVEELAQRILANPKNQGVTFSGGEPFWQAPALAQLAALVKAAGLNVMSFPGFTLKKLRSADAPPGAKDLLAYLDLLIDGPFVAS